MQHSKKRNVIHSIRMDQELEESLNQEAELKRMTFNSLVNSILYKHSEFGTFAERFGFVTITRNTFQAVVSAIGEDDMDTIARDISSLALKEFTYFKYKNPGVKAFIDFLSLLCNYGGLGLFEHKTEGLEHKIILRHNLGTNMSILVGKIISETMKRLADIEVEITDNSENEVDIKFKMDPFNL